MATDRTNATQEPVTPLRKRLASYLRANMAALGVSGATSQPRRERRDSLRQRVRATTLAGAGALGAAAASAVALPITAFDGEVTLDLDNDGVDDIALWHLWGTSEVGGANGHFFHARAGITILSGAQLAVTTGGSEMNPVVLQSSQDFAAFTFQSNQSRFQLAGARGTVGSFTGSTISQVTVSGLFGTTDPPGKMGWLGLKASGGPSFAIQLHVAPPDPWYRAVELTLLEIVAGTHAGGATAGPAVPEPHSLALLGLGAAGIEALRRRRRRRTQKA